MRMPRTILTIVLFCVTLSFTIVRGYTADLVASKVEDLFSTVAYIQGQYIEETTIDNSTYDVYIKKKDALLPIPFFHNVAGTGFFVSDNTGIYLVTAEHIARKLLYNISITVHGASDVAQTFNIEQLVQDKSAWTYHGEADVAVIKLYSSKPIKLEIVSIKDEVLLNDFGSFNKLRPVTTIGFPLGLGKRDIGGKFSPITRSSKVASGQFQFARFDTKTPSTFVVLEDPSVAGFSGSPVFALSTIDLVGARLHSGPLQCIGLVHGTLGDDTGGKFAAIVPAKYIIDTIKKSKLIK